MGPGRAAPENPGARWTDLLPYQLSRNSLDCKGNDKVPHKLGLVFFFNACLGRGRGKFLRRFRNMLGTFGPRSSHVSTIASYQSKDIRAFAPELSEGNNAIRVLRPDRLYCFIWPWINRHI